MSVLLPMIYSGTKRKHREDGLVHSIAEVLERAEERAAEREEKMRTMELYMEERRREREERREIQMMSMFTAIMQHAVSSSGHASQAHLSHQPPPNLPPQTTSTTTQKSQYTPTPIDQAFSIYNPCLSPSP